MADFVTQYGPIRGPNRADTLDSDGNLTRKVDPLGVGTELFYSASGFATKKVADAAGLALTSYRLFDANNRVTAEVDALSQTTAYAYDGFRKTKVTSPGGVVTENYYDVDGLLTKTIQAAGTSDAWTTTFLYNATDLLTKQTLDPSGLALATEFQRDAAGRVTRVKNPDGNLGPSLSYDAMNRLTLEVLGALSKRYEYDAGGRFTRLAYGTQGAMGTLWNTLQSVQFDGLGRRTKQTDAIGHYTEFSVDVGGNLTKTLSYQSGATLVADVRTYFDEVGQLYKTERMLDGTTASTTQLVRDVAGRVTKQTDPLSNNTQFAYDALSRLTRTTDPLSQTSDRSYDALGRVTLATDALSNASETWYDLDGQVTKSVDAIGNARTFAYDSLGRVTRTTDPLNNSTDAFYDSAGRTTKSSDPGGGETTTLYDAASRQTKVTVKVTATASRSTTFQYSNLGQLTRTTDPLSNNTDQSYDLWGRVTKTLDAEGNDVQYSYDLKGQLTLTSYEDPIPWDEMGVENRVLVSTEYDGLGRRTRVLNDNNTAVLRWQHDRLGRLTKLQYANNDAETYLYNIAGQQTKLTRPTGELISYLYDARGALTKTTLPGSVLQVFQYDDAGRRTHADDPNTDLDWHLDAAGRITKVVDGTLSKTIVYSFDAAGRRTSLDGPEASDTQAWSFDSVGRVTKITENAADRAEWLYDLAGAETKLTYGSGSYAVRLYDGAGRLTSLAHKKSDNSVIQSFAYVLDKVGNRTKLTLNGGDFVEYQYDPLYQLTREHRKTSGGATQYYNEFYYDYISNRTKLIYNDGTASTTTTYLYNTADQLTKSTTAGTDTTYSYSANGNLTRRSSGGSNEDYLYDARNLITKYDAPGTANDTTYNWDLLDRRVKKDLNGTVTRFLYDDSVGEIIAEYDGSGTPVLQASYVPTGLDSNVSMIRSGTAYYFHSDPLQSTWNLTQASDESIQNSYAYQAFGSQYGTPTENATNTRRFTGAEWNTEDSTQTHGVRRYHPTLGRWNRRDPLLDVDIENLYLYGRARPTIASDPTGLQLQVFGCGLDTNRIKEGFARACDPNSYTKDCLPPKLGTCLSSLCKAKVRISCIDCTDPTHCAESPPVDPDPTKCPPCTLRAPTSPLGHYEIRLCNGHIEQSGCPLWETIWHELLHNCCLHGEKIVRGCEKKCWLSGDGKPCNCKCP